MSDPVIIDDDCDDDTPVICGACDGTGEAGRFGQLVCRPCRGSGEVLPGADYDDDYDDWDACYGDHLNDMRKDPDWGKEV
jgi:hypothetical protein